MKTLTKGGLVVSLLLIGGCGGGGGGGGSAPLSPAGLWIGTTGDSRDLACIVLSTNALWCIYSQSGSPLIEGLVQGTGTVNGNSYTSNNAIDFDIAFNETTAGTVSGTFAPKQTFTGSVSPSGTSFTLSYDARFDITPNLAQVAGDFAGQSQVVPGSLSVPAATAVIVESDGGIIFATSSDGFATADCEGTGTLGPRSEGNVFNVAVNFGVDCTYVGQTFAGVAFYDVAQESLDVLVISQDRSAAAIFVGAKL